MATEMERRFAEVIRMLRDGEVVSYGDVAADAGFPGRSRAVGRLLAAGADDDLPWWRVVNSSGRLVPGNEVEHEELLRAEGVTTANGRVIAARYGRFRPVRLTRARPSSP